MARLCGRLPEARIGGLRSQCKPGSFFPSDEKERKNNFDPGVTERTASSPEDHVLASGGKLKMSLQIVRQFGDWSSRTQKRSGYGAWENCERF